MPETLPPPGIGVTEPNTARVCDSSSYWSEEPLAAGLFRHCGAGVKR